MTRGPEVLHGSQPPPPENTAVHAWYRAGKALDEVKRIEGQAEGSILRLGGELAQKIEEVKKELAQKLTELGERVKKLERATRRSGHDLKEVQDWQEDSEVRHMRERVERTTSDLARVQEELATQAKIKAAAVAVRNKRAWDLFKSILLLVLGAVVASYIGAHPIAIH